MDSISVVELISIEGELVTGPKPVPNVSVVFTRPWVKSEVTGVGEEGLLPGNVGDSGEGDVMADKVTGEDGELVSSTEAGLVQDISLAPVLMGVISAVFRSPRVTAVWVPTTDVVVDVSQSRVLCDVAAG